jgi:hypothetical protein
MARTPAKLFFLNDGFHVSKQHNKIILSFFSAEYLNNHQCKANAEVSHHSTMASPKFVNKRVFGWRFPSNTAPM